MKSMNGKKTARSQNTKDKKISKKTIRAMAARLAEKIKPEQIYLFGSYAWGKPSADSDIDFCLVFNQVKDRLSLMVKASSAIDSFNVPNDIIVRTSDKMERMRGYISPLEGKIQSQGIKLYDAARRNR